MSFSTVYTALTKDRSSVPSTHARQLITVYKSNIRGIHTANLCVHQYLCATPYIHTHHTYTQLNTNLRQ